MASETERWQAWVLIGVSGSGKTRIGGAVASALDWPFLDADDMHSAASIARMAEGIALDDDARWPWLGRIGCWIDRQRAANHPAIIACSALKRSYRDALRTGRPGLRMIQLRVDREELVRRLGARRSHFMDPELLDSQLASFELPRDEDVAIIDANGSVDSVVDAVLQRIAEARKRGRR